MSIHSELLGHLRDRVPERMELSTKLGGDGRVCCYYVCPFSTLRKIMEEGIRCRSSQPECIDLSSPDVQSRRNTVWLGQSDHSGGLRKLRDVPIHSCVNLFWNPLNRTFDAFQRNGLLRAAERTDSEHGLLCLLEVDTERLLNEAEVYWTATNGNAAAGAFASFEMHHLRQFPWAKTYALGPYTREYPWQPRAAELIVRLPGSGQKHTSPVPRRCFTRVILPPEVQLTQQQQDWLSRTGLPAHRAAVFKTARGLLEVERLFVWNCVSYRQADTSCMKRLAAAFRIVTEFESRFGGPAAACFQSPAIAHGPHGIGHVARVMFWSAFLATYPFGQTSASQHTAAVLAAFLHDLGRESEGADQGHGERSLEKYRNLIEHALDQQSLRESCASAVRMHGVPDSECPVERRDQLWELVKDADGLERGRFARPDRESGCNPTFLRFGYINDKTTARQRVPWLAYQLHGITKHSQWERRPCRRLLADLFLGLGLGLTHNVFQGESNTGAQELHRELGALRDELAAEDWCEEMREQLAQADEAYAEYDDAQEEEERLYQAEQEQERQEWLDSDEDNDWDDHDLDWAAFDWDGH